jgi:hypothetical protein
MQQVHADILLSIPSVNPWATRFPGGRASALRDGLNHRDPIEQRVENVRLYLDAALPRNERLRQPEHSDVETFVQLAHSRAVEEQDLQRVATPPEEDEERPGTRLPTDQRRSVARSPERSGGGLVGCNG